MNRKELQTLTREQLLTFADTFLKMKIAELDLLNIHMGWNNEVDYNTSSFSDKAFQQYFIEKDVDNRSEHLVMKLVEECQDIGLAVNIDTSNVITFIESMRDITIDSEFESKREAILTQLRHSINSALNTSNPDDAYVTNANSLKAHILEAHDNDIEVDVYLDKKLTVGEVKAFAKTLEA